MDLSQLTNRLDREFISRMYGVLHRRHAEKDFAVDSLAVDLGMSRRSVQRKVKALTGRTPLQLITDYRLNKAVSLLRNTSIPITDVAYETGFGDLSHFYRLFKKTFGKNPTQYRAQ